MSFYRFARATALIALFKRYRSSLLRIVVATSFAIVTSLVYPDIAEYVEARHPQALGWVLALKTLVVYCALFVALWELHRAVRDELPAASGKVDAKAGEPRPSAPAPQPASRPLDTLVDKPKLRSRKDALLDDD